MWDYVRNDSVSKSDYRVVQTLNDFDNLSEKIIHKVGNCEKTVPYE